MAFASTLPSSMNKFAPRAVPTVFFGYPRGYKGYKLYSLDTEKFSRERESCLLPLMSSIAFPRNREENITNRTFSFFLRFHFTYFFPYNFEFRFFFLIFFLSPSLNFLDAPFSHGTVEKWRKFEFF